jgi:hypothetical protein
MSRSTTPLVRSLIGALDCVASHPAAAVHRLSLALARTAGLPDVSRVILRHIAGALRASSGVLAVVGLADRLDNCR